MVSRRRFFRDAAAMALPIVPLVAVGRLHAQQVTQSFAGPMEQDAYRPVKLVAKAGAKPSMTDAARDDLEHSIKCQCGCSLDVYTCRTTDFSCSVSPAMHEDVMSLVGGGYSAKEILAAFQSVYGERVLMSPVKSGFNWLGYTLPSVAIAVGALFLAGLMRRWRAAAPAPTYAAPTGPEATDEELSRISAAIRKDQ